ncbi:MAG: restriction endonuclease subunit S, partial [Coriobacteriia bacterium]|nr:restriction endonuclease subunit S [Coriobacteriia bacterium]
MKAERLRLKYLTSRPSGDAWASSVDDFISLDAVESWTGQRLPLGDGERDLSGTPCKPGDLLFGKLRPYLAKVHLVETDSVCASEFIPMRPGKDVEPRFLRYVLSTEDFVRLVDSMSYGTKMPRVDPSDFLDIKLAVPPPPLQARIADYLDSETARIDTLIDRKQRFIDLLLEKRTAVITHAVTKGLDPDV